MRYAIISDIHSNLESLKYFLKILSKLQIERIICLGDVVGYNANPNECIQIISSFKNLEIIRGNHDRAVVKKDYYYFSQDAKNAIKWTINNINPSSYEFLDSLIKGPKIIDNTFAICHGSAIDEDNYLLMPYHTKGDFYWLKKNNIKVLFFGHSHYQCIFCMDKKKKAQLLMDNSMILDPENLYLINPGSIGQPRDNDPRASFAIFDTERMQLNIIRYRYPIKQTQSKIINNNLPHFLAERLAYGY